MRCLIIAFFVVASCAVAFDSPEQPARDAESEIINVHVFDLVTGYYSDESGSDAKFKGHILEVEGTVKEKNTKSTGSPHNYASLGDNRITAYNAGFLSLECLFGDSDSQEVKRLPLQKPATIRGVCEGITKYTNGTSKIILKDSVVVTRQSPSSGK